MKSLGIVLGAALALAAPASAKEIVVKMLNVGSDKQTMVFEPAFVKAAVGDTVRFQATNPGHNAQTIDGGVPAGAVEGKGQMGKDYILNVSKPGLYAIKCLPHYSMGMVALVQGGNGPSPNLAQVKALKLAPLAQKRMTTYLAQAK